MSGSIILLLQHSVWNDFLIYQKSYKLYEEEPIQVFDQKYPTYFSI